MVPSLTKLAQSSRRGFYKILSPLFALALSCNVLAQDTEPTRKEGLGLNIDPYTEAGTSHSSYPRPIPEGWNNHYSPGKPTELNSSSDGLFWDVGLRIEPSYRTSDYQIGLPVFQSLDLMSGNPEAPFLSLKKEVLLRQVQIGGEIVFL